MHLRTCCIVMQFFLGIQCFGWQLENQLHIGDSIPYNLHFFGVKNYPTEELQLSDFRGKNIILDFWTKNCSSCISAMPKMQKLQSKYEKDLQVLLITPNSKEELSLLFSKSEILQRSKLPMIFDDTLLTKKFFPHWSVPHHVWINRHGKIVSINDGSYTNDFYVSKMILDKNVNLPSADDLVDCSDIFNKGVSLALINNGLFKSRVRYFYSEFGTELYNSDSNRATKPYSLFLNRIDNCKSIRYDDIVYLKDSLGNDIGVQLINYPLDMLFMFAYSFYPDHNSFVSGKVVVENNDGFAPFQGSTTEDLKLWRYLNSICYETCFPNFSSDELKIRLKNDLKRFLGIEARIEETSLECWSLVTKNENYLNFKSHSSSQTYVDFSQVEGKAIFMNQSINRLISELQISNNMFMMGKPIIVNETGISENVRFNITLPISSLTNFEDLNIELSKYGFTVNRINKFFKVLKIVNANMNQLK